MRILLFILMTCCCVAASAQSSSHQSISTAWGNYVNTNLNVHGNVLVQVTVEGANCMWNGLFSLNGTNSHTPDIPWNNVKLISYSGYNASVDDVQALIMSNSATNAFGNTFVVLKLGLPASGTANISVTASAATTWSFSFSLVDNSTSPPFTYTMASSAGTYNMWTVNGKVGIGTTDTKGYLLAVKGNAIFEKVKVQQYQNWPDHVFDPAYRLRTLHEVEQYIQQHHHLPEVPSAAEVNKNGIDVGDNQAVLLKKIEELTLYVIDLKKENERMNKKIEKQEREIRALNKRAQ
jgi:hypothetical protein